MLKQLFTAKRRRLAPRNVRRVVDPMPRIRWYS
jgi:hypothetical protein